MVVQFTVRVNEGKWIIAKAISEMPIIKDALQKHTLVLKGGTTVSCVSEILTGIPLRISGRITERGAVSALKLTEAAHTLAVRNGETENIDRYVDEYIAQLGPGDVIVTGANLIDVDGNAAMLAGSCAGGLCGKSISASMTEGVKVLIAAGLEKLAPNRVKDSVMQAHRKGIDRAEGMACGLFPVYGSVITELEAIRSVCGIDAVLIGKGGIGLAAGSMIFQAEGTREEIEKINQLLDFSRNQKMGGEKESLQECSFPSPGCRNHLSCCYKMKI